MLSDPLLCLSSSLVSALSARLVSSRLSSTSFSSSLLLKRSLPPGGVADGSSGEVSDERGPGKVTHMVGLKAKHSTVCSSLNVKVTGFLRPADRAGRAACGGEGGRELEGKGREMVASPLTSKQLYLQRENDMLQLERVKWFVLFSILIVLADF